MDTLDRVRGFELATDGRPVQQPNLYLTAAPRPFNCLYIGVARCRNSLAAAATATAQSLASSHKRVTSLMGLDQCLDFLRVRSNHPTDLDRGLEKENGWHGRDLALGRTVLGLVHIDLGKDSRAVLPF